MTSTGPSSPAVTYDVNSMNSTTRPNTTMAVTEYKSEFGSFLAPVRSLLLTFFSQRDEKDCVAILALKFKAVKNIIKLRNNSYLKE